MAQYLYDLFELFGRLASFRHHQASGPELQTMHLHVAIYAYFHRQAISSTVLVIADKCKLSYLRKIFLNHARKRY